MWNRPGGCMWWPLVHTAAFLFGPMEASEDRRHKIWWASPCPGSKASFFICSTPGLRVIRVRLVAFVVVDVG